MVSAASTSVPLATRAPFRVDLGREAVAVTVDGVVPAWLRGRLVRTAPAVFAQGSWQAEHWFDALGMVYGFTIDDDGIGFVQRQLASDTARDPARSTGFGTPMARSRWQRLLHPVPAGTDNTNVNILALGDDLVAFTETDRQWVIDPTTLHAVRPLAWQDGVAQS
ncbi:MAG TPA: carotenoid oxygenase family protein, partial [Myxococcota bacterium]